MNNNDEAVIVSHMGWDGTRIVGLFSSREEAIEAVADFKLNSVQSLLQIYYLYSNHNCNHIEFKH